MRVEEALKLVISGGAVSPVEAFPIEIEIQHPAPIATEEGPT
jgi:uncharacterized membrane protein